MTVASGFSHIVRLTVALLLAAAVGLAALVFAIDGRFVDLALFLVVGGLALAAVRSELAARTPSVVSLPDPFARGGFSTQLLNVSSVRVAGLGGAGLVVVAAAIAMQFRMIGAAVFVSVIGGAALGGGLIGYHAWRRKQPHAAVVDLHR